MQNVSSDKKIVLFDGVCNLCNSSVQFIIKHDQKEQFVFGSLQGKAGQQYLTKYKLPANSFNSFMLVEGDTLYTKSGAALRMLKHLGGAWSLLYGFMIVPRVLRDAVYNLIARNRYAWFGKTDACWLPSPELKQRFLD